MTDTLIRCFKVAIFVSFFAILICYLTPNIRSAKNSGFWERSFAVCQSISEELRTHKLQFESHEAIKQFEFRDQISLSGVKSNVKVIPFSLISSDSIRIRDSNDPIVLLMILPADEIAEPSHMSFEMASETALFSEEIPNAVCVLSDLTVKAKNFKQIEQE